MALPETLITAPQRTTKLWTSYIGSKTRVFMFVSNADAEAGKALISAMAPYTFGINGAGRRGAKGAGIGAGVGIRWGGHHLIVTAAHTIEETPEDGVRYFLPVSELQFADSPDPQTWTAARFAPRQELIGSKILISGEADDLAVIRLPAPSEDISRRHFYELPNSADSPIVGGMAGYFGFPDCRKVSIGNNFAASPFGDFGRVCSISPKIVIEYDPASEEGIHNVDPHGLSGSGVWDAIRPDSPIWCPSLRLVGIVDCYDPAERTLEAYGTNAVLALLMQKRTEGWL